MDGPDGVEVTPGGDIYYTDILQGNICRRDADGDVTKPHMERSFLQALPPHPFDCANINTARASSQFRVVLDTNRYSVPARFAGAPVTVKAYPDRICIYHQGDMIARHVRSYDRHQDMEDPDHPRELLAQRKKARDQKLFIRFFSTVRLGFCI